MKIKKTIIFLGILLLFLLSSNAVYAVVKVKGYFRKNGTYVQSHYRSDPDGSFYNNWSTKGNINPYTGKVGTKTLPINSYNYSTNTSDL